MRKVKTYKPKKIGFVFPKTFVTKTGKLSKSTPRYIGKLGTKKPR